MPEQPFEFRSTCPNGHLARQGPYPPEALRTQLASDPPMRFHCSECDAWWTPTREDVTNLLRQLSLNSG